MMAHHHQDDDETFLGDRESSQPKPSFVTVNQFMFLANLKGIPNQSQPRKAGKRIPEIFESESRCFLQIV